MLNIRLEATSNFCSLSFLGVYAILKIEHKEAQSAYLSSIF